MDAFKPLLAEDFVEDLLRLPGWLSPKYDGIRSLNRYRMLITRSNKPVPNIAIREKFAHLEWLDFELIHGEIDEQVFERTTSVVRTVKGSADNVYAYVFDHTKHCDLPYYERHYLLQEFIAGLSEADRQYVRIAPQFSVESMEEMLMHEEAWLAQGYEGAMFRDPKAHYKCGRSTVKEGILLKIKRFKDAECRIIGFVEQLQNTNEAFINELGRTKRSAHKEGMVGKGTLGALQVVGLNGRFKDVEFSIGGGKGLDAQKRQDIWDNRDRYLNQIGTYQFFEPGSKNKPRFPLWKGLRMVEDLA